ncbi:putative efflux protein, MATE family [Gemmobacter aquatilis]|uniref:Putative efflux protein, MATE family n=1 Tax=Gemmobacter aquatilis TaxID=933059 RepID=A0A1H8IPZ1_9RHOB|nr:MATE family efflux transporter [Gemmobacter aquatilis]SEN70970.1 putative efflux protein, MATE family [Gemmobacter aquatilis]
MVQAKFVEGNLFRHVAVMSLTSSVGLMAIFVVDLINMVYISWLQDEVKTAAIGYAGAVLFFTTAFGIGLSVGVSALVARAIGGRDMALARERATEGLLLGALFGVLFAAVVWLLLPGIVNLLGAEGRTAEETLWYLRLVTPSQPLLMIGMIGGGILRSHGDARRAMMVTVWGAIALAVLDPVLILWADLGLTGAALAGWGSRAVIAGMALWPIWRHRGGFVPVSGRSLRAGVAPLFAISGAAILTQLATPVGQAVITRMVAGYGEAAVAGMAIAGRLTPVAFGMIFALSGAIGPIIGQNMGAGRMDRVRRGFWDAILFAGLVILAMSALLFLCRGLIADLFHAQGLTRDLVYLFCGPLSLLFFFNALIFVANALCNNLGAAFQSTLVNWGRHTLGTVPFALWMAMYWGPQGVLIGQAVGGIVFGILAVFLALRVIDRRAATF